MQTLWNAWKRAGLVQRIAVGLVLGAILGVVLPRAQVLALPGDLFVGALKALAPVLVFFLVMSSLAHHREGQRTNMKTVLLLYLLGTFLAALSGVAASFLFPSTLVLTGGTLDLSPPAGVGEVLRTLLMNAVSNPVASMAEANFIGVLVWAVILGLALRKAPAAVREVLSGAADALSTAIGWVIRWAPLGILGLVYGAVSSTGLKALGTYLHVMAVLVGTMVFVALVMNPLLVFLCIRKNPYPLVFRCLRSSGVLAFFTRSSAANIPVNLALCEKLGLNRDKYSVSIPLGATINMAGGSVTISVLTLAAANTLGIDVDFPTALLLSLVAAVSACGASGVAGGSLLLIPMACGLFGIPADAAMEVVGIGFILGVVQDSCETALNSSSDVLFTATAEFYSRRKGREAP